MNVFGDIRSILAQEPSPDAWQKLLALIQKAAPDEQRDVYLPYIQAHMDKNHWPEALRKLHPDQTYVALQNAENKPWLQLIRAMHITYDLNDVLWPALASDNLTKLTHLSFAENGTNLEEMLTGLLEHDKVEFKSLILPENGLDDFPEKYLHHPKLKHLEEFKYRSGNINESYFEEVILKAPFFANLRHLNLESSCHFTSFIPKLVASLPEDQLETLGVGLCGLQAASMEAIANSPKFTRLSYLSAWNNNIGDDGIIALSKSPHVNQLRYLNIGGNVVSDAAYKAMTASENFQHLELLWVWSSTAKSNTLKDFFANAHMPSLKKLNLNNNKVSTRNLLQVADSPIAPNLEELHLYGTNLTDRHIEHLLRRDSLQNLRYLDLSSNHLTDEGLMMLADASCLQHLEHLQLSSNTHTQQGVDALAKSPYLRALKHVECEDSYLRDTSYWPENFYNHYSEEDFHSDDMIYNIFADVQWMKHDIYQ